MEDDGEDLGFSMESMNLEDIELDESELAEFGLIGDSGGDVLTDIQTMADESSVNPAVQGNFGMIRVQHSSDADYNIDHVVLTPEDENDPALLVIIGSSGFFLMFSG